MDGPAAQNLDFVTMLNWVGKIAENTASIRDLTMGRTGANGAAPESKTPAGQSQFEAMGKRIETALTSAVGQRLSQAQGLANRGFQGTVEGARFDYAMEQLSRQMAGVFKPMMDAMAYGAGEIEKRMRGLTGTEQNRVMGGLVGAGIGLRYGGGFGAVAGGLIGSAFMGDGRDMSVGSRLGAAAGSAYLGFRAGGPWGAAGAAAGSAIGTSGDYTRMREGGKPGEGKSRFVSGVVSVAAGLYELPHSIFGSGPAPLDAARRDWDERRSPRARAAAAHRDVTPFSADPMEVGGTAEVIQKALIRATAGAGFEENGGPFKALIDVIVMFGDQILKVMTGGSYTPPPRSADAARG